MKQRSKVITTSIATIAMCASLAVGGTFALFTSETQVNVAVTSGTVDVVAYADEATLSYTSSLGATLAESSATIVDNVVKIDKIVPGDTITFDLVVENHSNVSAQYQTVLSVVDGVELFSGLQVEVDGKVYNGMTAYSNWTMLSPIDGEEKEFDRIPVTITLPESAGNEYQNKTTEISFVVKAVQGNASIEQPASEKDTLYVYTQNDMKLFAISVNKGNNLSGKTVKLMDNVDLENEAWTPIGNSSNKFQGTFDGNGKTISNLYVEGKNGLGLFGYVYVGASIQNLTIDGAYVAGEDYLGAVVGTGYFAKDGVQNCVVKNAEIIATPYEKGDVYDGGAKAGVVAGFVVNGDVCGNNATDSTVTAYRDLGGIVGMMSGENRAIVAQNNTVDNLTLSYLSSPNGKYDGNKVNQNMSAIVGRISNATVENNTIGYMEYNMADGLQYLSLEKGGLKLHSVGAYASETLIVPEGVTALESKALQGNTTIKEVILPSTITDFGGTPNATGTGASGGFFYKSAVAKVTLPEGLTEIPAATFNQASNLKEVNIPSSVKTIGIHAFAGTGLETLTIPATVTSIGFGAFRDMVDLVTVTIEGDEVHIPDYTFRNSASLTSIYMNVNKLTLDSGNMAFTSEGTNNVGLNKITIYVTNDEVYDTLDKNKNVHCEIVKVGEIADSSNASEVDETLLQGGSVVLSSNVTYSAASTTANSGYGATGLKVTGGAVLDGNGNTLTVTNANGSWDCAINADNGTIKNLTVNGAFRGIFMGGANGDVYIDNVVIDKGCYTFNSDGGNKNYGVYISNSTLNGWTSYSNVHKEVVFENCNFGKGTGGYKYAFCRPYNASTFINCTFEEGFEFDTNSAQGPIVFENCYYGKTLITPANAPTLGKDGGIFFCEGLNGITINGAKVVVADNQASLQSALNNATGVTAISLTGNVSGNVTATQKAGVTVIVEGNGYTCAGAIIVDGKSATYTTAGLTINKLNFNGNFTQDACINLGDGTNDTRYTCNVTVSNCTFDATGKVGVKSYTGGDKNVTITGCTATANAHSLVQAKGVDVIVVEECKVYSKNGMGFNNSVNVTVQGCTVDVKGYAVRFGEGTKATGDVETYAIKNCTLKSACDDGDAVIVLRGSADKATLTVENTTLEGNIKLTNNATDAQVIGVNA